MNARSGYWLKLGPVFDYEWTAATRRWQGYALRSVFATTLLAALLVIVFGAQAVQGEVTIRHLATLGQGFYIAVIGTQLTLILLAAPAATAGAICLDRASGMMTHVLVTDLADFEIVLGKLTARLVPMVGLVACALPILAIMTLLGGVDPVALAGAFLVSLGVAVLGGSLAFFFSLGTTKTHEALLGTYAVWGIWLVGRPFLELVNRAYGWSLAIPPGIADPFFLAFAPYRNPSSVTFGDYVWFLVITSSIAAALVVVIIWRLRAVCTRGDAPKRGNSWGRFDRINPGIKLTRFLPGPSLDFNPVFWREWHRTGSTRLTRIVGGVYLVGAVIASLGAIVTPRSSFAMAWVNGLQVSIGMLLLSVLAATSLAEERVRGSLDVLMTTPLSTRQIVIGKWLGTFRLVPSLAVLPVLVLLCNDFTKWHYVPTILSTLVYVLLCGAVVTGLGLAMATWSARPGRAVALTVMVYVLLTAGSIAIGVSWVRGPAGEGWMMVSPFYFPGLLAADLCGPSSNRTHIGWAIFWIMVYLIAALALIAATLLTFDRCLGRIEVGFSPRSRRSVPRSPINKLAGKALDRPR